MATKAVPLHLSKVLAGWDDGKQRWLHHFSSLPSDQAEATDEDGRSFADWLQANASGSVPWKVRSVFMEREAKVMERIAVAKSGDTETLRHMLDSDIVARLLDKDKLGRTVLHAAAASGNLHAVRMLAARCSGWPVKFEPVKHGGISTEHSEHGAAKSRGHTHSSSSPRRQSHSSPRASRQGTASPIAGRSPKVSPRRQHTAAPSAGRPTSTENVRGGTDGQKEGSETSSPRPGWRTVKTGVGTFKNMLDARDRAGNTPLHLAAADGHIDVVEELLTRGAEVEIRNLAGRTALHVACMNHHLHAIAMLLSAGSSARARDIEGRRPMDMTNVAEVHAVLSETVGNTVAVRGGPTPFGRGDADKAVVLNVADNNFATEEEEDGGWDPVHGVRKSVGTAGPMYRGARLPRIRPVTPGTAAPDNVFEEEKYLGHAEAKEMRTTSKSVGFYGVEDEEDEEAEPAARRVAVRSGWYRTNERHTLHVPAQTVRSRCVGTDNVMEFEKKKLSVKRMLAEMKWARDRERRAAEGGAVGEDEDGIGTEQDDVRVRHDGS